MEKFFVRKAKFSTGLIFVYLLVISFIAGCSSYPVTVRTDMTTSKQKYEKVGEGSGTAMGLLLGMIIPIGQNGKVERAYNAAVVSRNGDFLLEPTIQESWFITPIGHFFVTTVSGTVMKRVR